MRAYFDNEIWQKASQFRNWRTFFAILSAASLALALLALLDGLIGHIRSPKNELKLIPGQSLVISAARASKNLPQSHILARFSPQAAPLRFEAKGFSQPGFFGESEWRGAVAADKTAAPGTYNLEISIPEGSAQANYNYIIQLFANARAQRASAHSFFRRWLNLDAFMTAAWSGGIAIILGALAYYFGRQYALILASLGLARIYRRAADGRVWCSSRPDRCPSSGNARMVLDVNGKLLGEATTLQCDGKGHVAMRMLDGHAVKTGSFVCLVPPMKAAQALKKLKDRQNI